MKQLLFPLALLLLAACGQKDQNAQNGAESQVAQDTLKKEQPKEFFAQMEFPDGTIYDFGNYYEREVKTHDFVVRNPGKEPLVISQVETGCSCITATAPKKPILEGQTDVIHVSYDGNGFTEGFWGKHIRVHANIKEHYVDLVLQGSYYNK
jgi:hypothetical protein